MRIRSFIVVVLFLVVITGLAFAGSRELDEIAEIYEQGDAKTAVERLTRYVAKNAKDDLAWTILGNAYMDLDELDKAEDSYKQAIKVNPRRFNAITGLGILSRKNGKYDEAMRYYKKALEIDPKYAQAYTSMVVIALKQEKDKDALTYAEKAYALNDSDPVILANLAVAYHYNGMYKERDKMTKKAEKAGYKKMDALKEIYSGEMTLRDK
jgi:Flp pilus assembly protein TadD